MIQNIQSIVHSLYPNLLSLEARPRLMVVAHFRYRNFLWSSNLITWDCLPSSRKGVTIRARHTFLLSLGATLALCDLHNGVHSFLAVASHSFKCSHLLVGCLYHKGIFQNVIPCHETFLITQMMMSEIFLKKATQQLLSFSLYIHGGWPLALATDHSHS